MAANIVKAGIKVVAYDILPERVAVLAELGTEAAGSPKAVAASANRTITMVETTAQTEAVIFGAEGVVQTAKSGHQIAMMSTVDPFATKRMHAALVSKGIKMVDAPVSGGTPRAASGELSTIVGGDDDTVQGWRPYFKLTSSNIFHVGQTGQGLAMKLVNNMLIQVNTVAIAE